MSLLKALSEAVRAPAPSPVTPEQAIQLYEEAFQRFQLEWMKCPASKLAGEAHHIALNTHLAAEEPKALVIATRQLFEAQQQMLRAQGLNVVDGETLFRAYQAGKLSDAPGGSHGS